MLRYAIDKVIRCEDLSEAEMREAMSWIMQGQATPAQIGGFLTALRMKGESVFEIIGSAKAMREKALRLELPPDHRIDTCGTGGDGANTFNVSTACAFVAAGAGAVVVKHGNRCVSSRCGSADVLEALGMQVQMGPGAVAKSVQEIGIGFLFAPSFHSAMRHVAPSRQELGVRTIFNLLGPLTNPAGATGQVLGVYDPSLTQVMAEVLRALGSSRALVVHGSGGLDELTITGLTKVSELKDGRVFSYELDARALGLKRCGIEALQGADPATNAAILRAVLEGQKGSPRDMVLLNAAAALYVAKRADSLEEALEKAADSIDSGQALLKLNQCIAYSQREAS